MQIDSIQVSRASGEEIHRRGILQTGSPRKISARSGRDCLEITGAEEQRRFLMRTNPKLYALAMAARAMREKKEEDQDCTVEESENGEKDEETAAQGVSWGDFEWTGYETQMSVSIEGEGGEEICR